MGGYCIDDGTGDSGAISDRGGKTVATGDLGCLGEALAGGSWLMTASILARASGCGPLLSVESPCDRGMIVSTGRSWSSCIEASGADAGASFCSGSKAFGHASSASSARNLSSHSPLSIS